MDQLKFFRKPIHLLIWILIFWGLYLTSQYNYLLFHSLVELFSVAIACGIFMIAWNARRFLDNNYFLFIGIAYLFIGGLDLIHTLAFMGMNIFQGYETNLPTQLWIAARYIESLSLFIAPFFLGRKLKVNSVLFAYALTIFLLLVSIFYWDLFPICFIEGVGLTPFKKISEYIISLILLGSIVLLLKNRKEFEKNVLQWLVGSIIVTIVSELILTVYINAYGFPNLIGHFLKIISFYFIYKAIIEIGLSKPYDLLFRNLKQSEVALRGEMDKTKRYLDIAGVILVIINADQTVGLINKKGYDVLGCQEKDILGKNWFDMFIPERERGLVKEAFVRFISGQIESFEYFENPVLTGTGEERTIAWHNAALRDEKGNIVSTISSGEDITERKQTEEALQKSEERFRLAINATNDGVWEWDIQTDQEFFSNRWCEIIGYSFDDPELPHTYNSWASRIHPDDYDRVINALKNHLEKGTIYDVEYRHRHKSGEYRWQNSKGKAVFDESGKPIRMVGCISDITERKRNEDNLQKAHADLELRVKERTAELSLTNEQLRQEMAERQRAENALRESEIKYKIVADNTYDWEWWMAPGNKFIYSSPSCKRITGREPKEFIEDPNLILRIIHPEDRPIFLKHRNELEEKNLIGKAEFRIVNSDGSYRWIGHVCQPIIDREGNLLGRRGSNRDITERKIAEENLKESEHRLRLLSSQLLRVQENERKQIAQEIHDSLGQTLAAIKFGLESKLSQMNRGTSPSRISIEQIITLAQSCIEEARRIQMDLRPSVLDDLGIISTIGWFVRDFQKVYSHISVEKEVSVEENEIPDSLKTALFRLMQEAMNNIAKHSQANLVHLSLRKKGDRIELSIEDNGSGFGPQSVKQGLGLTTMRERAELLGGEFYIESTLGKGTTIKASWPL